MVYLEVGFESGKIIGEYSQFSFIVLSISSVNIPRVAVKPRSINQSINQSNTKSVHQSMNTSVNQS